MNKSVMLFFWFIASVVSLVPISHFLESLDGVCTSKYTSPGSTPGAIQNRPCKPGFWYIPRTE